MNIQPVLDQLHIRYQTEGHKHCRPGWANTSCPYCTGNPGLHLGFRLEGTGCYCWRCGSHPIFKTLSKISGVPEREVRQLASKYVGVAAKIKKSRVIIRRKAFQFPSNATELLAAHRRYLKSRKFQPDLLAKTWGLLSTGPVAHLDKIDYRWRIIAPIWWDGVPVSFQGRTVSKTANPKYKACPQNRELIQHQRIVYAHPEIDWAQPVVITEGITDVWRLGIQAIAVFGIDYTVPQIRAICKKKKEAGDRRIVVLFDDDPQAMIKGTQLTSELCFRGMEAKQWCIKGDPGGMNQKEADQLMEALKGEEA